MREYLVQHSIDRACAARSGAVAVSSHGADPMTYAALDELSSKLAGCLTANGVRRQDRLALLLRRGPHAIAAIVGGLKADAAYVPIDPKAPTLRQIKVLDDCRPSAVVCESATFDAATQAVLGSAHRCPLVVLDRLDADRIGSGQSVVTREEIDSQSPRRPAYSNVDTDLAYVLYTSGSTGAPKGVMVSHRNILNYITWAVEYLGVSESDSVFATAPFHFDMSTFDVFAALTTGARLCIAPEEFLLFPSRLIGFIEEEGATIWKTVPSLFAYMARTGCLKPGRMSSLSRILFGGEPLHPKHLGDWMSVYPEKAFYNAYGPTETTGVSLCYRIRSRPDAGQARVPIGAPRANTEALVITESGGVARAGESGELWIRGAGVASGYWRDPEKTGRAFVSNPLAPSTTERVYRTGDLVKVRDDGDLEFLGRNDEQVKYMGYRIALSDIEAALVSVDGVADAAALLDESEDLISPELVGLVAARAGAAPPELGKELALRLPAYMVPKRIVLVPQIPRSDRGKVARDQLRLLLAELRS
jgi:D-alanine--poly(phosphoribitol) ligase subunit 1